MNERSWRETLAGMHVSAGVREALMDCARRMDTTDDDKAAAALHVQLRGWAKLAREEDAAHKATTAGPAPDGDRPTNLFSLVQ